VAAMVVASRSPSAVVEILSNAVEVTVKLRGNDGLHQAEGPV
jgi:hypothetical protein